MMRDEKKAAELIRGMMAIKRASPALTADDRPYVEEVLQLVTRYVNGDRRLDSVVNRLTELGTGDPKKPTSIQAMVDHAEACGSSNLTTAARLLAVLCFSQMGSLLESIVEDSALAWQMHMGGGFAHYQEFMGWMRDTAEGSRV